MMVPVCVHARARKGDFMELSNNQTEKQIQPASMGVRIFCCIVLFACSAALPLLPYYIGVEGAVPTIPLAISLGIFALCAAFILKLCRKPLFLSCTVVCALILLLLSPYFTALFLALLCATVAGALLFANAKRAQQYVAVFLITGIAFSAELWLTKDAMLAAQVFLPVLAALALGICYQKKYSIILSVGAATGVLLIASLATMLGDALIAGMQPSLAGVTAYIEAYHATVSAAIAESVMQMAEMPEIAAQLPAVLGGELTEQTVGAFSDSVASAVLGMLPGAAIMLTWLFSFVAHRGFTALMVRGMEKQDYPAHLTAYAPSVPTAIFMILCYAALLLSSFSAQAELITFIALNLLLAVMPLMTVCGILSIVANVKRAPVKWPLLATYGVAIFFLGIGVIPMVAFFGSFAVITNAIAAALEKKFNSFKGGQ